MSEFDGKRVVVTGACGVFGTWIARAFTAAGAPAVAVHYYF